MDANNKWFESYFYFTLNLYRHGDTYDLSRNPQGTEIKAITYSNMQIHENEDRSDIYVIVDI